MIAINEKLTKSGMETKMILQVHDELVFDVPDHELKKVRDIVRNGMEEVIKLKVPVEAHIEVGKNWLEMDA
jgi:DNA polymerase-1